MKLIPLHLCYINPPNCLIFILIQNNTNMVDFERGKEIFIHLHLLHYTKCMQFSIDKVEGI